MIIDARGQHPTLRHASDPIFDSLRRWTRTAAPTTELSVAATLDAMDQAQVSRMLISAWVGPRTEMISNDEVAGFVAQAPARLTGVSTRCMRPAVNSACPSARRSATPDP